jgi:hypothetical protein
MTTRPSARAFMLFACLLLSSAVLVGCDEVTVGSRQEAEQYAKDHPNAPTDKILIRTADDSQDESLNDLRDRDAQNAKNAATKGASTEPSKEGEVLLYEDTASSTAHEPVEIFNNGNIYAVFNGGTSSPIRLDRKTKITEITTYHWNDAKGQAPGTIELKDEAGTSYGRWQATSQPGQGGVPNATWIVTPNIDVPAGTYTVVDSDPATWSQNEKTGGAGMTWAKGIRE